ncbi:MAG: dipeptidase PepE, partial [Bacteroidales bacterium]|nr:dipeptidase PepE [Bacteroidales bacterium]
MRLLLISNSTNPGEPYLEYPKKQIELFLGKEIKKVLFIPYAAVTISYDEYYEMVNRQFNDIGYEVQSIHRLKNPAKTILKSKALIVGGGNTFKLLKEIQDKRLIKPIRKIIIEKSIPYIGWSAGANLACPTIQTTNDMPVVEPDNFKALNLVPFQINPHYTDFHLKNHGGETREQRILEYLEMNPGKYVVGLREGTMIRIEDNNIRLIGEKKARIF